MTPGPDGHCPVAVLLIATHGLRVSDPRRCRVRRSRPAQDGQAAANGSNAIAQWQLRYPTVSFGGRRGAEPQDTCTRRERSSVGMPTAGIGLSVFARGVAPLSLAAPRRKPLGIHPWWSGVAHKWSAPAWCASDVAFITGRPPARPGGLAPRSSDSRQPRCNC